MTTDAPPAPPPAVVAPADPAFAAELDRAEHELAAGQIAPAQARLLRLEASGHRETQLLFLLGLAAFASKDYPEAVRRYRAILAREPRASRVRLELARTFYEAHDWRNAERQFRFAPVVARKVDGFLAQIRRRRTFTSSFSVALAPDSNVNAGPTAENVTLYGLPFELSQDARSHSGVGLALSAQAAWTPHLSDQWRWDATASGYSRLYSHARFDEAALVLATGPHLVRERIDASLHATATRRWFAGDLYAKGYGGALEATWYLTGRTALTGTAEAGHVEYPHFAPQTGPVYSLSAGVLRALTAASYGRIGVSWGRENAQSAVFANYSIGADAGYVREFGAGITASLGGRVRLSRYDDAGAFDAKRRDEQYTLQGGLTFRKLQLRGLAPSVTVTETINDSNISLYQFRRTRVEFGLNRTF